MIQASLGDGIGLFFKSMPKSDLKYDSDGIPFAPRLPFELPLIPDEI
jgi:hypothetical protein